MRTLELKLNKLFWFLQKKKTSLDFSKDRHLIIHQTLALGSMDDTRKLFRKYGKDTICREFQKPVRGLYTPSVLHFFEYVLGVRLKNSEQYIKNIYGKTLSRHS